MMRRSPRPTWSACCAAWDADAGTLPSRLWDVVDAFDPLKLMDFDPFRVTGIARPAFGISNPQPTPERLAAAQQIAAINRRLVTTDSFDLPVPGGIMPTGVICRWGRMACPASRMSIDDDEASIFDEPTN